MLPILQGKERKGHDVLFWEHEGNRAVRKGKWKIVADFQRPWELYDIENDRTELNDLAKKYPRKVRQLGDLYDRWATECHVLPWEDLKDLYTPKVPLKGID